jgi:hypothetical protein
MQRLKSRLASALLLLLTLVGMASEALAQSSMCTFTLVMGRCVGCRTTWGPSYYVDGPTGGCIPCYGYCMSFLVAKNGAETDAVHAVQHIRNPNAVSRELYVSSSILSEMAAANPWAANVLLGLQRLGAEANLQNAVAIMGTLATTESVHRLLAGDDSMAKSLAMPPGVAGRVSYRLERFSTNQARLHLSSYTVDEDSRVLFKVYPDVTVTLVESSVPSENGLRKKAGEDAAESRTLTALSWKVME